MNLSINEREEISQIREGVARIEERLKSVPSTDDITSRIDVAIERHGRSCRQRRNGDHWKPSRALVAAFATLLTAIAGAITVWATSGV